MASPATVRKAQPLDGLRTQAHEEAAAGPQVCAGIAAEHLRLLGAQWVPEDSGTPAGSGSTLALGGPGFEPVTARMSWASGSGTPEITDEATAQAATGIMAVHGRRDGRPRGLAADYASTATAVLTVQGLLAGLIAQARGRRISGVSTAVDRAGLLTVSQYLAAAGAEEPEAEPLSPGGPPFTSSDGTVFELETLDPGAWATFWRSLGAPERAVRAGWRPFQFRYATACAPFPDALHATARSHRFERLRQAAGASGAQVCALRPLASYDVPDGPPWTLVPYGAGTAPAGRTPAADAAADLPLHGLTVLEAGRRIQAPLAAHLLGLLGADVVRIEPPGGDPLRGMPPACSGVSARWLALNRGKRAVEADITTAAGRRTVLALAAESDVFLHNWAPGKAAQLGLDHEDLAAANGSLVYAYTGGWAGRVPDAPMGTDFMVQARTGVGEAVRPADEPPVPSLMTLLDVLGGLLGAEAVLAALLLRERTGQGIRADSSLLGAAELLTAPARERIAACGPARRPAGFRRPLRTADGWIAPADAAAAAARAYDLRDLPTDAAVSLLRGHGLAATAVADVSAPGSTREASVPGPLRSSPLAAALGRDTHGAPVVPSPWSFV